MTEPRQITEVIPGAAYLYAYREAVGIGYDDGTVRGDGWIIDQADGPEYLSDLILLYLPGNQVETYRRELTDLSYGSIGTYTADVVEIVRPINE